MTALHCDPDALAGILRERQGDYEFAVRGSVRYYQRLLDFGAWLTGLRNVCAHGVWMRAVKAAGCCQGRLHRRRGPRVLGGCGR